MFKSLPLIIFFSLTILTSIAQQDSLKLKDADNVSLEDLLNMNVTIASQKGSTIRETPGIITIITEEEIKLSGARDFVDVMRLVPGIDFGSDVGDQVGMYVRGNWANEGKILIMQDGLPLNENSYGTVYLTDFILVANIKKIEIIRGPGSAVYGGLAGLAVINIITKSGEDLKGGNVTATYGISNGSTLRNNLQMALGTKTKSGIEFDLTGMMNQSKFSNGIADDRITGPINFRDSSSIKNYSVTLHAAYKGINFRTFQSNYQNQRVDNTAQSVFNTRNTIQIDYELKIGKKLSIKPKLLWQNQAPWNYKDIDHAQETTNTINNRYLGNLSFNYDLNATINFLAGVEYFDDNSKGQYPGEVSPIFVNGQNKLHYTNFAAFASATISSKIVNITAGARYNKHSAFKDAFVPRIAITKTIKNLHFKALYSSAFKAPLLENIDYTPTIKPENISITEFEMGYKLSNKMILNFNVFDQTINRPIVFYSDSTGSSSYQNFNNASSRGIEAEYRYKTKPFSITATYSYYQNKKTDVSYFLVLGKPLLLRGAPAHKFTISGSIKITKDFSINPTMIVTSPRYNYVEDSLGAVSYIKYESNLLMHLYFRYEDLLLKGLDVGIGAYNIFNQNPFYINAYSHDIRALPYSGREYLIKASYTF